MGASRSRSVEASIRAASRWRERDVPGHNRPQSRFPRMLQDHPDFQSTKASRLLKAVFGEPR